MKFKASRLKCRKAIDTGTGNWHVPSIDPDPKDCMTLYNV